MYVQGKSTLVHCPLLKHHVSPDTHSGIYSPPCTLISTFLSAESGLGQSPTEAALFHSLSNIFFPPFLSNRVGLLLTNTSC